MIPRPCALAVLVVGKKARGILGANPPRHGLTAESVTPVKRGEKKRPICPLISKWQIGLLLGLKALSRGCGLPQGERERKVKHFSLGPP